MRAAAGRAHRRPEWVAAAAVLAEYLEVTALSSPGAHDPAAIVQDAAALLRSDPALLAAERARWSLVAVEDHHESTPATAELVELVAGAGADLLLVGDPDATTSAFRGGDPGLLVAAPERLRGPGGPAPVVVLPVRWRAGAAVAAASQRVAARTGSSGVVAHRSAAPPPGAPGDAVEAHVLRSPAQQAAFVAAVLRAEHVRSGTPWGRTAVVVRSTAGTAVLRRALAAAGVPVAVPVPEVPVRAEPAVVPLVLALRVVLRGPAGPGGDGVVASPPEVLALLTSPLGGADALAVRRLRQVLLAEERAGGGTRSSDALLVEAVGAPGRTASLPARAARPALAVARVLAAGRDAARSGGSAEEVLWALWAASGLAGAWRRRALAGGPAGERADRDLDAVVTLFDAASRYEEREPGAPPQRFLEHLESQDVPSDTLADHAPEGGAVALLTPQGAVGREWDVVCVPGLQEGAWPDVRLRGTLLGAPDLADALDGRLGAPGADAAAGAAAVAAARRRVLDDEHRLLQVAVTRARRRLVLTAVRSEDERPSGFLDLVSPPEDGGEGGGGAGRPLSAVPRLSTLPALVAELRAVLLTPDGGRDAAGAVVDGERRGAAAAALARLAAAGVPGADPDDWAGLVPVSDDAPLRGPDELVPVRPSAVEAFSRCGLRWLMEGCGGRPAESVRQGVGVLVHQVAQELPEGTGAQMAQRLEELWPRLGLPTTWVGERERRSALRMVARLAQYVAGARAAGRSLIDVETEVETTIGRALVRGRLDRLERTPEGGVLVVDLKTGSSAPAEAEIAEHPQLGVYQVLVAAGALDGVAGAPADGGAGPAVAGGAMLVQVGGGRRGPAEQLQEPLGAAADPRWAHDLLERTADGMAGARFEAVVNDGCARCSVRTCCPLRPEGSAAVGG